MVIGTCKVYMRASWVRSLKEKRSVLKSLIERIKNKFNVSIAEIEMMDSHQDLVVGFACVTNNTRLADAVVQNVLTFLENNTDAQVEDVVIEIL